MPHKSKTSAEAIVKAANDILESEGVDALSMRAVARRLRLAPNALYYYYPNKESLEDALAAEGFIQLYSLMTQAVGRSAPNSRTTIERVCRTFIGFARAHPSLFTVMWARRPIRPDVVERRERFLKPYRQHLRQITGRHNVSQAMNAIFSLVYGVVMLEQHNLLQPSPKVRAAYAVSALLRGFEASRPAAFEMVTAPDDEDRCDKAPSALGT
jgi:AcrR family transcriptional regulator